MLVLGLDPGSRQTGFGVVERDGKGYRSVAHGHVPAPPRLDLAHRIHHIAERAGEIMDRYRPDCVAVEEAFYPESVRSTLVLGHVRGALVEKGPGSCVIEAAGIGYLVSVSNHTAEVLPRAGEPVFLRTRQVVREDAVTLFGFADPEELRLFDLLIAVSGVGPKLALALLSGLKPHALAR